MPEDRKYLLSSADETIHSQEHQCKSLETPSRRWSVIKAWWYFPVHLIWSIATCIVVLGPPLHRRVFPVRETAGYLLTQSDVSTILSLSLKITSIICSTLQGILAWRCAFIALERKGMTFSQLSTQVSYKIGPVAPRSRFIAYISFALILAWPAQLAAPVLSGAIAWVPTDGLQSQQGKPVG